MKDYTIIIPAYNEADVIGQVLKDLGRPPGCREVIVVDDGSTDQTAAIAKAQGAKVIAHAYNRGYGAALKTGILAAQTDIVIGFDGDGQHRVEDLLRIVGIADQYDMVIGVRGRDSGADWQRRFGKFVLQRVAALLTHHKIPDLNCGLRSFRTEVIRKYLHLMPNGFSLSTTSTIAMYRMGHSVQFVPVATKARQGRKSTVKIVDDGFRTLMLVINLTVLFNPMRVFLPLSFFFILGAVLYFIYFCLFYGVHVTPSMVLLFITGVLIFFMGIICEQVSSIRRELYK